MDINTLPPGLSLTPDQLVDLLKRDQVKAQKDGLTPEVFEALNALIQSVTSTQQAAQASGDGAVTSDIGGRKLSDGTTISAADDESGITTTLSDKTKILVTADSATVTDSKGNVKTLEIGEAMNLSLGKIESTVDGFVINLNPANDGRYGAKIFADGATLVRAANGAQTYTALEGAVIKSKSKKIPDGSTVDVWDSGNFMRNLPNGVTIDNNGSDDKTTCINTTLPDHTQIAVTNGSVTVTHADGTSETVKASSVPKTLSDGTTIALTGDGLTITVKGTNGANDTRILADGSTNVQDGGLATSTALDGTVTTGNRTTLPDQSTLIDWGGGLTTMALPDKTQIDHLLDLGRSVITLTDGTAVNTSDDGGGPEIVLPSGAKINVTKDGAQITLADGTIRTIQPDGKAHKLSGGETIKVYLVGTMTVTLANKNSIKYDITGKVTVNLGSGTSINQDGSVTSKNAEGTSSTRVGPDGVKLEHSTIAKADSASPTIETWQSDSPDVTASPTTMTFNGGTQLVKNPDQTNVMFFADGSGITTLEDDSAFAVTLKNGWQIAYEDGQLIKIAPDNKKSDPITAGSNDKKVDPAKPDDKSKTPQDHSETLSDGTRLTVQVDGRIIITLINGVSICRDQQGKTFTNLTNAGSALFVFADGSYRSA